MLNKIFHSTWMLPSKNVDDFFKIQFNAILTMHQGQSTKSLLAHCTAKICLQSTQRTDWHSTNQAKNCVNVGPHVLSGYLQGNWRWGWHSWVLMPVTPTCVSTDWVLLQVMTGMADHHRSLQEGLSNHTLEWMDLPKLRERAWMAFCCMSENLDSKWAHLERESTMCGDSTLLTPQEYYSWMSEWSNVLAFTFRPRATAVSCQVLCLTLIWVQRSRRTDVTVFTSW